MSLGKHKIYGSRESRVGEGNSSKIVTKYFCNTNLGGVEAGIPTPIDSLILDACPTVQLNSDTNCMEFV